MDECEPLMVGGRRAVKELRAQGALMRLEHRTDKVRRCRSTLSNPR